MKKALIIIFGSLVCLVIAIVVLVGVMQKNLEKLTTQEIGDVNITEVPDGTYRGEYSVFPVIVKVDVTVASGAITEIIIVEHQNGQGGPAEVITGQVVSGQTLDLDLIAGATYSSKVILLAIENALVEQNPS
ncbi:MAG TPA: FMN-binding domain-containing protein [Acholeplasmatales bacterium]|nr:FMN-binding domain-containing protein [Acholeplasmatales bacterium]